MYEVSATCPNCGGRLVELRRERQIVGSQAMVLQWSICVRCQHVALSTWAWEETDGSSASTRRRHAEEE